jgi:hypothetical protein
MEAEHRCVSRDLRIFFYVFPPEITLFHLENRQVCNVRTQNLANEQYHT